MIAEAVKEASDTHAKSKNEGGGRIINNNISRRRKDPRKERARITKAKARSQRQRKDQVKDKPSQRPVRAYRRLLRSSLADEDVAWLCQHEECCINIYCTPSLTRQWEPL